MPFLPGFPNPADCRLLLLSFLFIFPALQLGASGIRGKVMDENGTPLPYATIVVKETGSGAVTNPEGTYEIRLEPGSYELSFQFLGYRTEVRKISVATDWVALNVQLQIQPIELKMAGINLDGEDPAYTVMRKAIAKAAYHRQQLNSYEAQVYVKGSGRLIKAPFYARKALKKEGIDSSKAFTTESISLIEYKRPNSFKEKVISVRTRGEDNSTSPMPYINGSFYQPELAEAISPLSPKAFAYYRFKLESFFIDRGYGVNKIKVSPRSPGENVFDGYLYIVEDYWSIYSLSLGTYKFGIRFDIDQVYSPIEEKAWLPVSHKFKVHGKVFGFAFEYNYLATASKYAIELNPDLAGKFDIVDEQLEKDLAEQIRQQRKESPPPSTAKERLNTGGEVTRKEMRRILTEYEKEEEKEAEQPEVVLNTSFTIDSQAYKRDSLYWETIRPIPLTELEVKGYRFTDSLAIKDAEENKKEDSEASMTLSTNGEEVKVSASGSPGKFKPLSLVTGRSYRFRKKHILSHGNMLTRFFFNPVEGFNVSNSINYRLNAPKTFGISLTPRYAFARSRFSTQGRIYFRPVNSVEKRSLWEIQGGRYTFQFNPEEPISEWLNTYLNLAEERNFIRLYEKEFARIAFQHEKASDWKFSGSVEWARRFHLSSRTTQTWFPRDDRNYGDNTPDAEELVQALPGQEKATVLSLAFEIRPWQRYQVRNGRRSPVENSSPTLSLNYRKGIQGLFQSEMNYDFLELEFKHTYPVGPSGLLDLRLNAGWFPNHSRVGFADYKHFLGNQIGIVTSDPVKTYRLLDYYRYSTQELYFSGFAHHQFRKFLLTRITPIWIAGLKENLFVNYLSTPKATNYFELGYGIDNIFRFFRLEAAASFEAGKYRDFGVFIGIATNLDNLNMLFGN